MEDAITALEAWADECPEAKLLLHQAMEMWRKSRIPHIVQRALVHHIQAARVVWSDASCPRRQSGQHAIGRFSMDLWAVCLEEALWFAPCQHMRDLEVAATLPLCEVPLDDGRSLEDFLVDELQVRTTPARAQMRVQGLVVCSKEANVKLRMRQYGQELQTNTIVLLPNGKRGFHIGTGEVGVEGKCIHFTADDSDAAQAAQAAPPTIMAVTLWTVRTKPRMPEFLPAGCPAPPPLFNTGTYDPAQPVYRGLSAAKVTVGTESVPDDDPTLLQGMDVMAVRVEMIMCHVAYGRPTDDEVDDMCRRLLAEQLRRGVTKDTDGAREAESALHKLDGLAFCHQGHGPYQRGVDCPQCQARVVCTV